MLVYVSTMILLSNLFVGILLGISSIGGFLLPLIFAGFLGLPLRDSLALSFLSFAVAGVIGGYAYWKSGHMDGKLALWLSAGSIPGALLGVKLNVMIPDEAAKMILYGFVLLSGLSLLYKKSGAGASVSRKSKRLDQKISLISIGMVIAAICALTGAGGPIILVPLLSNLGVSIRVAVGVCLLNSAVIALPSVFGYFQYSHLEYPAVLITVSLIGITIGIFTGSHLAGKVKVELLSISIAMITVLSSLYMIAMLWI